VSNKETLSERMLEKPLEAGILTPSEIEQLRQRAKYNDDYFRKELVKEAAAAFPVARSAHQTPFRFSGGDIAHTRIDALQRGANTGVTV
jgi:hypothetical protein